MRLCVFNHLFEADSVVLAAIQYGTNTQGVPVLSAIKTFVGHAIIKIVNVSESQALNGTLKIAFFAHPLII